MLVVRDELSKYVTSKGADPTGLGRWNYVGLVKRGDKLRFISACPCVKSKSTLGTVCLQRRRWFLARKIDVCPLKFFILHLTQFTSDYISLGPLKKWK